MSARDKCPKCGASYPVAQEGVCGACGIPAAIERVIAAIYQETGIPDAVEQHMLSGNPAAMITATTNSMSLESIPADEFYAMHAALNLDRTL